MADLLNGWVKGFQFFDNSGDPLNGGKLYIYDAGTTSDRTVYTDDGATTPHSQPIVLDSAGRLDASVYFPTGDWKYLLTDSSDVTIDTEDNIPGAVAASSATFARPQMPIITKAANYTVTSDDIGKAFICDGTGGAFTLTMPAVSGITSGQGIKVLAEGTSGAVTIARDGSDTINGASSYVLRPTYGWVELVADGSSAWYAFPSTPPRTIPAAKTSAYTVTASDEGKLIPCDASSAAFTVTLLAAATAGSGFRLWIKKTDSDTTKPVTVDGNGSETIDGATTATLTAQYELIGLISDGSNWHVTTRYALGLETVYIPAGAMVAATTSGPASAQLEASTNKQNYKVLDFDASADEYAHFQIAFPESWDLGTITFQVYWTTTGSDTDGVTWALQGVAYGDSDAIDASWGTAVTIDDAILSAAGDVLISGVSGPVTIAGSPAAGELSFFRLFRDVSDANDVATEDARLIGARLFYTVDKLTDST